MKVYLNGTLRQVPNSCTVAELLRDLEMADQRVAVEVNREIVPASEYADRTLAAGDRIEVVHAIGGGAWRVRYNGPASTRNRGDG